MTLNELQAALRGDALHLGEVGGDQRLGCGG